MFGALGEASGAFTAALGAVAGSGTVCIFRVLNGSFIGGPR
jgi:hypothetical protein